MWVCIMVDACLVGKGPPLPARSSTVHTSELLAVCAVCAVSLAVLLRTHIGAARTGVTCPLCHACMRSGHTTCMATRSTGQ